MWIMTNVGFISAVDKAKNRRRDLHVRARAKHHLLNIFPSLRPQDVQETLGGDYRYRADVARFEVARVIGQMIAAIDYDNFKDSVTDKPLKRAYGDVWHTMGELQPGGPYNWGARHGRQRGATLFDLGTSPAAPDEDFDPAGEDNGHLRAATDGGVHVCEGCMDEFATWTLHGQNLCDACVFEHYDDHSGGGRRRAWQANAAGSTGRIT